MNKQLIAVGAIGILFLIGCIRIFFFKDKWKYEVNGYIWDRRIFSLGLMLLIGLVGHISLSYGIGFEEQFYAKCEPENYVNFSLNGMQQQRVGQCRNLIYNSPAQERCPYDWCKQEFLSAGEYGIAPPGPGSLFSKFGLITLCVMGLSFMLNHKVHNSGKMPEFRIAFPKAMQDVKVEVEEDEEGQD